jgi:riboflavin kinase / FMN adenylyltransferase
MLVSRSLDGYMPGAAPVATIGTFDGVHEGHRVILRRVAQAAKERGGESVVISFHPHPRVVLRPADHGLRLLHTVDEKIRALDQLGIDRLVLIPFTPEFSHTTSQDFIRNVLSRTLNVNHLIVGYDHRFGADRGGGLDQLRAEGPSLGFTVEEISAQQIDEANVSSSRIRHELTSGHVADAARLLGYPYELSGTVVHGKQLGRTLGFPTANLAWPEPLKLIPALGIYVAWAHTGGVRYSALVSIGRNPTVTEAGPVTVEAYLLDFSGDLYGQPLRLQFLDRLRGEVKFDSVEGLVAQMRADEIQARELFESLR